MMFAYLQFLSATLGIIAAEAASHRPFIDPRSLPNETIFPGHWERFIKAPANKTSIRPVGVWAVEGNVTSDGESSILGRGSYTPGRRITFGEGGMVTLEFEENIAGRACLDVEATGGNPSINLAYSESHLFAGELPDATTDRQERDLPLKLEIDHRTGVVCVAPEFVRGGFKYLTLHLPPAPEDDGSKFDGGRDTGLQLLRWVPGSVQKVIGGIYGATKPARRRWITLRDITVNCTAFPSQLNGRAYSGYFYSSNNLLNRIWYAGAYTLQLSTIDPREGGALIDYNRLIDRNKSPTGSWYSNFTIANGTAVTTDGAKRDRMVWPGDMYIAVPGIAVSTYDMEAVRNALEVLFYHQYPDGSLPYAGPPMGYNGEFSDSYHLHTLLGVYNYVLYSGDLDWLGRIWPAYIKALNVSLGKVDPKLNLLRVTSSADWLRPGLSGHNLEASALLRATLAKTIELARWLGSDDGRDEGQPGGKWNTTHEALQSGIHRLFCPATNLYSDNLGRRGCNGPDHVDPQDGNSWALISDSVPNHHQFPASTSPKSVSKALKNRWLAHGAPSPEFPNVISPFASSFELLAHSAAGNPSTTVELILLEWGHLLDQDAGFTNSTLAEGFRVDGNAQYPAYWSSARNSHCHGWSAGPTSVLVTEAVLGIRLLAPGGKEWVVRPRLTKWLSWARGGFATGLGKFEVRIRRVRTAGVSGAGEVPDEDGGGDREQARRSGQVIEIYTPSDTTGVFEWVHESGGGGKNVKHVEGGGGVAYVVWNNDDNQPDTNNEEEDEDEDEDDPTKKAQTIEKLDLSSLQGGDKGTEENWYKRSIPYKKGVELVVFDDDFRTPEIETRPVGSVDWKAMGENYI